MPVSFQGIRSSSGIQVAQGGTGQTNLPAGEILIGNNGNPISSIPVGSEGQILTVINGEWAAANNAGGGGNGGLSTVNTSGNIQGDGSSGSPVALKSAISLTSITASFKGDGSQITGLTAAQVSGIISSVSSSGNIEGDGTSGSPIALKSNISLTSVTASFNGSGAGLTNLTASQISGLNAAVDARITNIPNSALQNSSININGSDVALGGVFTITVPSGFSGATTSGNISGDGLSTPIILNNNISLTSVTASFNGSGAGLSNIPNNALSNSSITINGSSVALGGSVTVADQSNMYFTGSGFAVGNVVALSGSLVKADYSDDTKSNAFGVVSAVAGTDVTVKVFGEVTALSASNYSTAGTLLYVGVSGSVTNYAGIPSGKYITQVGILSPNSGKIIIQPRIYGQKN